MKGISYTLIKRRQKMHKRAYAVLCLIIAVSMGFYTFTRWEKFSLFSTAVEKNKEFTTIIREAVSNEKAKYEGEKDEFDSLNKEINEKLAFIFPSSDNYTTLTRQFDGVEEDLSKKNNPFEVSNIDFQAATETEYYSILPVRLSIQSSGDNFTKFLQIIENSGSLDDQVRLMDIQSIRLNFNEESGEAENIKFTVQLNAYFQK